jgi:TonB family protein
MVTLPVITFARLAIAQYRFVKLDVGSVPDAHTFTVPLIAGVTSGWEQLTTLLNHAMPWMVLAWCAGVIVFCSRLGVALTVARGLKLRDTQPASDGMQCIFDALCKRLAMDRAVRLAHSVRVHVPTVIGWLKPVVLLPVGCLTGLSERQIEALLAHELAHIRRNDYLVSVLQSMVETALFYHPAVWWISKQVRREREYCCDEMAVKVCGDRLAYARALSLLEERRAPFPMALGANGGVLIMRIRRLLGYREEIVSSNMASMIVLAIVIAGSGGIIGRLAYAEAKPTPAMPARTLQQAQESQAAVQAAVADAQKQAADAERQAQDTVEQSESAKKELSRIERDAEPREQRGSGLSAADRRQLDEARKNLERSLKELNSEKFKIQLQAAQQRLKSGELREQLQETQKQLMSPEFQKHLREAIDAAMKANSVEIRKQIADAQKQLSQSRVLQDEIRAKLNNPEFRKQIDAAKLAAKKVNSPEFRKQLEDARKQAAQFDTPEFREKIRQMADQARRANTPEAREQIHQMMAANSKDNGQDAQPSPGPAPAPNGPIRVSSAVMAGQVVSQVPPVYPPDAKNAHIQGTVVLKAIVGKTGDVEQVSVVSGPPELTHSAIDAVSKWKYKPYLLNGQPVAVLTTVNVNYSLEENSGTAPAPQSSVAPGSMPKVIHTVPVEYTPEARAAKIQGPVVVRAVVNQQGVPENVRIVRGLDPGLDRNAIASVNNYRFEPAMEDGRPVAKGVSIEVQYRIF